MKIARSPRTRRPLATAALGLILLAPIGCASPQHAVKGLVDTGFNVARHVVVGTTELTFKAAEAGGKGVVNALVK